jgi:hypothetical protein
MFEAEYKESSELLLERFSDGEHLDKITKINYSISIRNFDEAEYLVRQCLFMDDEEVIVDFQDEPILFSYKLLLGRILSQKRNLEKANELFVECLDNFMALFGPENDETLTAMFELAIFFDAIGKYEDANGLHIICYENRVKVLGQNHPDTLLSMRNLGSNYRLKNKFVKAEDYLVKAYDQFKALYGETYKETIISMNHLG